MRYIDNMAEVGIAFLSHFRKLNSSVIENTEKGPDYSPKNYPFSQTQE